MKTEELFNIIRVRQSNSEVLARLNNAIQKTNIAPWQTRRRRKPALTRCNIRVTAMQDAVATVAYQFT
jgi:hypothetical protein